MKNEIPKIENGIAIPNVVPPVPKLNRREFLLKMEVGQSIKIPKNKHGAWSGAAHWGKTKITVRRISKLKLRLWRVA